MRLKLALLLTLFTFTAVSLYCALNSVVSELYLQVRNSQYETAINNTSATDFFSCFSVENGRLILDEEKLKKTGGNKCWVQVLDKNGNQIDSLDRPMDIPLEYGSKSGTDIGADIAGFLSGAPNEENKSQILFLVSFNSKLGNIRCSETISANIPYDLLVYDGIRFAPDSANTVVVGVPKVESSVDIGSALKSITVTGMSWPKFITLIIISVIVFIVALLLAERLLPFKDIIKFMGGITRDDYKIYPEKGLFKNVFIAMNGLSSKVLSNKALQAEKDKQTVNMIDEVKNSLAVIKGYGEILSQTLNKPQSQKECEYIKIILQKSDDIEHSLEEVISKRGRTE